MRWQDLAVVHGYRCEFLESRLLLTTNTAAVELLSTSPAVFVKNVGQWADPSVKFVHQGDGANIAMTNRGPVFELFRDVTPVTDSRDRLNDPRVELNRTESKIERTRFSVDFLNANVVSPVGQDVSSSTFNYLIGDVSTHRSNVQGFEKVVYPSLWSGIDLHTWGQRDSLKYEFHIAPGSDYHQIALRYEGINQLWIDRKGRLNAQLTNGFGTVRDDKPVIYQEVNGRRIDVAGRFKLLDEQSYTFELTGEYNSKLPLIVDPDLAWGSYLGGSGNDPAAGIAIDDSDNAWITGVTYSTDFPGGGFDSIYNGDSFHPDAFVAKINVNGTVAWGTYLGGSDYDSGNSITVDNSGNAWITGITCSTDFPGGGFDSIYNGDSTFDGDAFVAKVNANGTLAWGSYLGGSDYDSGNSITVDNSGNAWIAGSTSSTDFPGGGFDSSLDGGEDAYVAKINSDGTLAWGSYLGGSDYDSGGSIAVDGSGIVWVTGNTCSTDFPGNGFDSSYKRGFSDAFIAKVNANGTLAWGRYLGGSGDEGGRSIAVDGSGDAWVTGFTTSTNFPGSGFDSTFNGGWDDAFVARINANGTLAWGSYLGGSRDDIGSGIAIDGSGNVWVTGATASTDFPGGGFDNSYHSSATSTDDAFVVKVNANGTLAWGSYLGGSGSDDGRGISFDSSANAWVTGWTNSTDFPGGGFDSSYNGGDWGGDAFVAKITVSPNGTNHAPIASVNGPSSGVRGQPLTYKLFATDVDADDLKAGFTYQVSFGDGTTQIINRKANNGSGLSVYHAYRNRGSYKFTLTATDKHGKTSAVASKTISVSAVALMPDPAIPKQQSLVVGGTPNADTIQFEKASAGKIRLTLNGVSHGIFNPGHRIFAFGQAGDDLIRIAPDLANNVVFFGGEGNDALHGGSGRNALFGNAGKDSIYGHGGKDILVGSGGKDLLKGDGSGDILIGGGTDVDTGTYTQLVRINDLLNAWNSGDAYAKRINAITKGVGTSKAFFSTVNVHDDAAVDDVHGGTGLDWFFANIQGSSKDKIHSELGEVITAIA